MTDNIDELFNEFSLNDYHAATRLYERDLLDPTIMCRNGSDHVCR